VIADYVKALQSGTYGAGRIALERRRQIDEELYSLEADEGRKAGELVRAAICYAEAACILAGGGTLRQVSTSARIAALWPWGRGSFNASEHAPRNLEKAGALIAAEIDRLERLGLRAAAAEKEGA
jgi:hypothetical protein